MIKTSKLEEYIYENSEPLSEKLSKDLCVNKHDLPGEWERQHQLYMDWVEIWAFSVTERDKQKTAVELEEADMDALVRADPQAFDIKKLTEGAIKSAVKNSTDYQKAVDRLHKATLFMNRMAGAKTAFEQRRKALENLTELAIAGFYSATSGPAQSQVNRSKAARADFSKRMEKRKKD
jgi:hypothetical protein